MIRWLVELYQRVRPDTLARILSLSFVLTGALVTIFLYDAWPSWRQAAISALVLCGMTALLSGATLAAKLNAEANLVISRNRSKGSLTRRRGGVTIRTGMRMGSGPDGSCP